jgi:hypothetical protein
MSIYNFPVFANPARSDQAGRPRRIGDQYTACIRDLTTSALNEYVLGSSNELILQGIPPEIQDQKSANWSPTSILGRSEPIQGYGDSAPRSITLNLMFIESLHGGDKGLSNSMDNQYVRESVQFLQSLVYPNYDGGRIQPPPTCLLVIGSWLNMRFITKDVATTWKGPWSIPNLTPMVAEVSLTIEEVNYIPWGSTEVRFGANQGTRQPSSLGGGRLTAWRPGN